MILVLTAHNGRKDVTKIDVQAIAAMQFIQGNRDDVEVETYGGKVYRGKPSVVLDDDIEDIVMELADDEPEERYQDEPRSRFLGR